MVYVLCAVLALTVLLLAWKILLLRRSAEEIRRGLQERLETDTNTLDRKSTRLNSRHNVPSRMPSSS